MHPKMLFYLIVTDGCTHRAHQSPHDMDQTKISPTVYVYHGSWSIHRGGGGGAERVGGAD